MSVYVGIDVHREDRQLRGRIQKNSQPSPAARVVTGPAPYALLTMVVLMGAAESKSRALILMCCSAYLSAISKADRR